MLMLIAKAEFEKKVTEVHGDLLAAEVLPEEEQNVERIAYLRKRYDGMVWTLEHYDHVDQMMFLEKRVHADLSDMYSLVVFVVKMDEDYSGVYVMDDPYATFKSEVPRKYCVRDLDEWEALKAFLRQEDVEFSKKFDEALAGVHKVIQRWESEGLTAEQAVEYFWNGTGLTKKQKKEWDARRAVQQSLPQEDLEPQQAALF